MSELPLFPRLSSPEVELLVEELAESGGLEPSVSHPQETYSPLGGQPATQAHLSDIREAVVGATEGLDPRPEADEAVGGVRVSRSRFDAEVGWALHKTARLSRTEAAHDDVWAWLTLVLLPDVALRRFPTSSASRFRGGARNVLRRTWWRVEVLGDLAAPDVEGALGEDEYVGVFERVSLGREPVLSRALVRHLQSWKSGSNRSEYARGLTRAVLRDLSHTTAGLRDEASADEYVSRIGDLLVEQSDGKWTLGSAISAAALGEA